MITHLVALLLSSAGFAALCIARPRHQQDMLGRRLSSRTSRQAQIAGWMLILAGFPVDIAGLGAAYGATAWFAHLSLGAFLTVAFLCWRVHRRAAGPA